MESNEGKHPKKNIFTEGKHHKEKEDKFFNATNIILMALVAVVLVYNQVSINKITSGSMFVLGFGSSKTLVLAGGGDLSKVDIQSLSSTAQTIAAVFPLSEAKSGDDIMAMMFPTGTPDYGEQMGVSFDDPVNSLAKLSNMFRPLKAEVEKNDPEAFQRYVALASNPKGVSCEYCCGVGPAGADKSGNSLCGCQHNPALLAVTLYLTAYTEMGDAEILREVMRWKTLFFPKNMIELASKIQGGDASVLQSLPGMVGGC
ncbi:hypothetical protein HYU14_03420 [Candidatus Woesearchaeota archaeon]|nr:hypothetical protein [Candidatus Woesearchaeota archaeon]